MEIPEKFYYIVGLLILTNLGTFGTMIYGGFKITWWFSKLDSRVDKAQETANRAHRRLDKKLGGLDA